MSTFFRLLDDVHIPDRWHLGEVVSSGCSIDLWHGKAIEGGHALNVEVDRLGRPLDFCFSSFAAPVARLELANAIAQIAGNDLQCLPAIIGGDKGYRLLNSVRIVTCMNDNESEFTKWTQKDHRPELAGQYRMVTKLQVDPKRIPADAHFFRIEGWRIALIVSETVRSAMEKARCYGAVFQAVT